MISVVVVNKSKKKAFRTSKRIITQLFPSVSNRVNMGSVPKRILIKFIKNLKKSVTKGTSIKIFIETKNLGFCGFKCIEVGFKDLKLEPFCFSTSLLDADFKKEGILP